MSEQLSETHLSMPKLESERQQEQEWARARVKRLRRVEAWLQENGVVLKSSKRGSWNEIDDDPWRRSKLAEDLMDAIDKGKLS
jgi:hypothetical protein